MASFRRPGSALSRMSDMSGGARGAAKIVFSGYTSISGAAVSLPALLAGDIIIGFFGRNSSSSVAVPSGYTEIATSVFGSTSLVAAYRKLTSDEAGGSMPVPASQTTQGVAVIRDCAGIGGNSSFTGSSGGSVAIPPIAGFVPGSRVVVGSWDDSLISVGAGASYDDTFPGVLNPVVAVTLNPSETMGTLVFAHSAAVRNSIAVEVLAQ